METNDKKIHQKALIDLNSKPGSQSQQKNLIFMGPYLNSSSEGFSNKTANSIAKTQPNMI